MVLFRLVPIDTISFVHVNCALWSSEVVQDGEMLYRVLEARSRGRGIKCTACKGKGATVGCCFPKCASSLHYKCLIEENGIFIENKVIFFCIAFIIVINQYTIFKNQTSYCSKHSSKFTDVPQASHNTLRSIIVCKDSMNSLNKNKSETTNINLDSFRIGSLSVISLGDINQHNSGALLHDTNFLFPNNYRATRKYWSTVCPGQRVIYNLEVNYQEVVDPVNGSTKYIPMFIIADKSNSLIISTYSCNEAVHQLHQLVNSVRDGNNDTRLRERNEWNIYGCTGPQFFGLGLKVT
jgi:hypothetical protein